MSVFDDLIDELKNENLLEESAVHPEKIVAPADDLVEANSPAGPESRSVEDRRPPRGNAGEADADLPQISEPANDREFFRKRAMEELSSLQMVEHVLAGVEREHMKLVPTAFDDLKAKQALHKFLRVSEDLRSPEHAEAEFALRHETEAWNFALYERDQKISAANVRRFCEESRPVLSSQALIALARFYRNSPYSEEVRGKFDYVVTRLFSREVGGELRQRLFEPADTIGHLNTLYANWSSIVLFTNEEDQLEVSLTVTRFEDFIKEADRASSFDLLLETDVFNRVRSYKEQLSELFFVPEVVAAAIRCNLALGNRYVELIGLERRRLSAERIEEKYGIEHDDIVSDVAGKTLSLESVARLEPEDEYSEPETPSAAPTTPTRKMPVPDKREDRSEPAFDLFGVNKWLMIVCIACIALSAGVYVWAEKFAGGSSDSEVVATPVKLEDPEMEKFIKSPRASADTFYAVVKPEYFSLGEQQKKELLEKIRGFAGSRNLAKVNLLHANGGSAAYASKDRLELIPE